MNKTFIQFLAERPATWTYPILMTLFQLGVGLCPHPNPAWPYVTLALIPLTLVYGLYVDWTHSRK